MRYIFRTLLFVIVIITGFMLYGYLHESVHQTILADYGIESEIEIGWKDGDLKTVWFDSANISEAQCNENCHLAHNINEAVGYHLQPFYFMISIGLLICMLFLGEMAHYLKRILEVAKDG